jgi:L-2-hydroxyglutarate oxidase LhgO
MKHFDVIIAGGGIIGLATAKELLLQNPSLSVLVAEKESRLGLHASGRNSGVLHAGFYYSPDSLKAKFCRDGNKALRNLADSYDIPVLNVGKVVVARDKKQAERLHGLYTRGIANGVEIHLLEASELRKYEPLATTFECFLWSPNTGISDPQRILDALESEVLGLGATILTGAKIEVNRSQELKLNGEQILFKHFVNSTGSFSDQIAHQFGVGQEFTMMPFLGTYRAVRKDKLPLQTLVYPVPHEINPFLGVHFTLTWDGLVKIGPTSIPILGREQYKLISKWNPRDSISSIKSMIAMLRGNVHDLPALAKSELPKIFSSLLVDEAALLVPSARLLENWTKKPPGIRAQLINIQTGELEQDFVVRSGPNSTHILNAVSPGWTSSIPFATYIVNNFIRDSL